MTAPSAGSSCCSRHFPSTFPVGGKLLHRWTGHSSLGSRCAMSTSNGFTTSPMPFGAVNSTFRIFTGESLVLCRSTTAYVNSWPVWTFVWSALSWGRSSAGRLPALIFAPPQAVAASARTRTSAAAVAAKDIRRFMVRATSRCALERVLARERAPDDQLVHLARALVQRGHPGIAQVLPNRVLVHVPVPAVDLDGRVRRADGDLARVVLRHRRLQPVAFAPVGLAGHPPRQQACGVDLDRPVGD